ncbi:MAG: hypothetical protein ACI837_003063 [Crocinitomicaceae bacterium]|jgi:hypothetical protein
MRILTICIILFLNGGLLAQEVTNGGEVNNRVNVSNNFNLNENSIEAAPVEEADQDSVATLVKPYKIQSGKDKKGRLDEKKKLESKPASRFETIEVSPKAPGVLELKESEELKDVPTPGYDASRSDFESAVESPEPDVTVGATMAAEAYKSSAYTFTITNERANTQRMQRSPSVEQQIQMDEAVDYFETNAPSSFEHNYFKYAAGNYDVSLFNNLEEAEKSRPDNADVHVQMAGYYMINEKSDSALIYMDKLRSSERLTENVIHYAEDVLRSVAVNGMLVTHGFDDSYGVYYTQQKNEIRQDVTLVSLDFMQSEHYRNTLVENGYKIPESTVIDVDYLAEFCTLNLDKNVSISLTTPKEYFKPLQSKLFVVGLVFEYHEDKYDNFYKNDYLWNEEFTKKVIYDPVDEKGKQLSANYLPMLLHLRKVYNQRGEEEKQKDVDEASDKVGVQCKKYEQVQKVKASY